MYTYMYVYVRIWWYMYVYVCISSYIRICMYFLEWHPQKLELMPRPRKTISVGGNRRATLREPQGIWASTFFCHLQRLWRPDLAHPTPRHASLAPEAPLSFRTEVSNARSAHNNPVPWRATADLAGWSPSRCPRASAAPPRKHLLTAIRWCLYMYVYVCICMYVYVYVCICMYIGRIKPAQVNKYVYVCMCTYMMVYVCICMYKFVYTYMYVFPGMTSSDTGTDAMSPKNTLRGRQ